MKIMKKIVVLAAVLAALPCFLQAEDPASSLEEAQKKLEEVLKKSPVTSQFDAAALNGSKITVVLRHKKNRSILSQIAGTMKIEHVNENYCDMDDGQCDGPIGLLLSYQVDLKDLDGVPYQLKLQFFNNQVKDISLQSIGLFGISEHYSIDSKDRAMLPAEMKTLLSAKQGIPMNHYTGMRDDISLWTQWIDRDPVDLVLLLN